MFWNQFSEEKLIELEHTILSTLKVPYETFYVPIELKSGSEEKIWTISLNSESTKTPLVLVHGFAAGIGFWCRNLDDLSKDRPVYAMDLLGPWLIQRARSDIAIKFEDIIEDKSILPNYVYQCNAQNPTGERAAYSMIWGYGWSKNPMILRIDELEKEIPITLIFGSDTWMDISIGQKIKELRPDCSVDINIIDDSGHHLYSEKADEFNDIVITSCKLKDLNNDNDLKE
ncbi:(Lyso)-N-acylphosphatidylethanolamine lipase-like isoform X2 [Coccinella septempunctata]|uniref:(Lyso)-N-acylphosphatidylethanolamine lipase-like isoform X2 n=1 Tax=Coccinella septempunctata TaxID=41139 RepID=UPI001D073221|nr:(Lyso)-N-acylphosphatidylethanolamine lipase-like isoform X2 [Coccinella septempunctata]